MKTFDIFLEFFDDPAQLKASRTGPLALQYPMHYHPTLELIHCDDGTFTLHLDKDSHVMTKGSFALIFPLAVHSFSCDSLCTCSFLHIPERLFLQSTRGFSLGNHRTGYVFDSFDRTDLLDNIHSYIARNDQTIAAYYALILLTLCQRQIQETSPQVTVFESGDYPLLREVLLFIQNHYKDNISLDMLCKEFSIGKSTLSRLINGSLQSSLPELVNKYRMLEAGHLLQHTQQPVAEIADTLGYASASNFTRNFHKYYGCSPREYRRRNQAHIEASGDL